MTRGKYSNVILVGDCRIRNLMFSLSGGNNTNPMVWCQDYLTFSELVPFFTEQILSEISNTSKKVLIICSLGIIDILKLMSKDDLSIFDIVEDIVRQMKTSRLFLKSKLSDCDIVFTNVLPLDVKALLKYHKKKIGSSAMINTLNAKIMKIIYLLEKNMITENLSRIDDLPAWNIFFSMEYTDSLLNNLKQGNSLHYSNYSKGIYLNEKTLKIIASKVSFLCNEYNKKDLITLEDKKAPFENIYIFSCYNIENVDYSWSSKINCSSMIKYISELSLENAWEHVSESGIEKENSLVIIQLGLKDFINTSNNSQCKDHEALKDIEIRECLSDKGFVSSFLSKMKDQRKKIMRLKNVSNVIFTTIFNVDIDLYQTHLLEEHKQQVEHDIMRKKIESNIFKSVLNQINGGIIQNCRSKGFPAWDFVFYLSKRVNGTYVVQIPSSFIKETPLTKNVSENLSKIFTELSVQTKLTMNFVNERIKEEKEKKKQSEKKKAKKKLERSRTPSLSPPPVGRNSDNYEWKNYMSNHLYEEEDTHDFREGRKFVRDSWSTMMSNYMDTPDDPDFWKQ